jgi:hypothetical protein
MNIKASQLHRIVSEHVGKRAKLNENFLTEAEYESTVEEQTRMTK